MAAFTPLQLGTYHMIGDDDYEPQRTNNFEVQIIGINSLVSADQGVSMPSNSSDCISLSVATFKAPSVSINPIEIPYGNNRIKYAGKPEFEDSDLVVNDYIGLSVERIVMAWSALVYNSKSQAIGRASKYKKTAYLIEFAPDGTQARQWQLNGCWPSKVELGEYNQEGGAVRQITATITYDYAIPLDS
jgi:hypothetical protein